MYRNMTDFCILILYSTALLNLFISSKCFSGGFRVFIDHLMLSAKSDNFISPI